MITQTVFVRTGGILVLRNESSVVDISDLNI